MEDCSFQHHSMTPLLHACLLGVCSLLHLHWLLVIVYWPSAEGAGCLSWFCSRSSGVRDRRTPDYATRQWSPGKVLPLRLLGVGQTRYYFTTGRKLAAGDGFAPSTSLSKSDELLVTLSRIGGAGGSCNLTIPD